VRTHRFDTPGPVNLEISIESGRVQVDTWDGAETLVELDSSDAAVLEEVTVNCEPLGAGHRVVVKSPQVGGKSFRRIFARGSLDVHVRAPEQSLAEVATSDGEVRLGGHYREVQVATASGDAEIDHVSGRATVNTASGDVSVESVGGRAIIRTASADVRCGRLDGGADVKTASGDVQIDSVTDRVDVSSGSGDIEIGESDSCKLRTASGDLRVGGIREGQADLKTASGDIDIAVISGAMVVVDAESVSGDLSSEIELSNSEPDGMVGGEGDREIELILRTVNGDIQVRRTRARATT